MLISAVLNYHRTEPWITHSAVQYSLFYPQKSCEGFKMHEKKVVEDIAAS